MGISLRDLDLVDVSFFIELLEQRNSDIAQEDTVEATPELIEQFFS